MDQILAQVSRAQRRLWLELFLNRALTCLFVTLAVALVAIAIPKFFMIENLPSNWTALCAVAGIVGGFLAALVWTLVRGLSTLDAAVELDNRFDLRERVSSSLALSPDDAATPAGQALLSDAARAIERVEVGSRFGITLPRRKWAPVLTTALAFVLMSFVGNPTAQSSVDPNVVAQAKEQRDNVSKNLKKRLVERKKQAAAKGLKETAGLFDQLEKETEKLRKNPEADQKQSLVKLNDLAKQLEKRRSEVGNKESMRKQLSNLDKLNRGPAEKMAEAMKEGDWQKALEELKSLQEQIKTGKLSEEQKKALAEQLKKLQEKLAEAKQARDQSMDEMKKQIQKQQEQGNHAKAGEMQQKLDQMQAQQSQMGKLQGLASKMGEAQQAMKQGDMQKASEAMDQMSQQMESLDQAMKEGEMLDAAMSEMQAAKEAMACQECSGQGCETCQSTAKGASNKQAKKGGGSGMGKGTAWGQRDDSDIDAKFRDSRVKQETGQGPLVYAGEADGPNIRGKVSAAVQTEMAAEGTSPTDPQLIDELPKSRREHAEEYFDLLREGR